MNNIPQRLTPHRLFVFCSFIFFISFLYPSFTNAEMVTSSEAKFDSEHHLTGITKPYSMIFIYGQSALPLKLIKSNSNGQFSLTYPFQPMHNYLIVIKSGNSFHYFTITYDEQALQEDIESGGGFMSGENDSYREEASRK